MLALVLANLANDNGALKAPLSFAKFAQAIPLSRALRSRSMWVM
jgi:hypothetical protein